jgi:hypothetical protein
MARPDHYQSINHHHHHIELDDWATCLMHGVLMCCKLWANTISPTSKLHCLIDATPRLMAYAISPTKQTALSHRTKGFVQTPISPTCIVCSKRAKAFCRTPSLLRMNCNVSSQRTQASWHTPSRL